VLREGLHVLAVLAVLAVTVVIVWRRAEVRFQPASDFVQVLPPPPPGTPPADCGPLPTNGRPVVVEMLYSEEKQGWIEYAADLFARRCPHIQIKLQAMSDIAGAEAILSGEATPTIWSPSDDIIVAYLADRWRARSQAPLFAPDEPVSLVRSPLVLLLWNDRLRVSSAIQERTAASAGPWSQLMCAGIPRDPPVDTVALEDRIPGTWSAWYDEVVLAPTRQATRAAQQARETQAREAKVRRPRAEPASPPEPSSEPKLEYEAPFPSLATIASWGHVEVGHSSPTHSAAGLEAVYLMAYDILLPPNARPTIDIITSDGFGEGPVHSSAHLTDAFLAALVAEEEPLRRWLARCEGGLEGDPHSAQLLTETMFHVGGERYDGVATYEHLVFPILRRLEGNTAVMSNVTVVYPPVTFVNQHPALLLADATDDPADGPSLIAARLWLAFLREPAIQLRAIELGFRPADPAVKIREHHVGANPFLRFRRYGVQFNNPLVEPPRLGGEQINLLLELWRDATGRN
jgi:hypothetical protein